MKKFYFRSMLISFGLTIIAGLSLIWLHVFDVGLAVSSGVIASMLVIVVSNLISWVLSIHTEKNDLKERYLIMLDQIGDMHILIQNVNEAPGNSVPGLKETLKIYNDFYLHIQSLHNDYLKKKFSDYYKLQSLIDNICIICKKINKQFPILQTSDQYLEIFIDVKNLIYGFEIDRLCKELMKLQDRGIVATNDKANQ
ncbi:MAG: hypothetical protein M0Q94_09440 [Candidatus Cloacimonetes bacterium]|nr:hypothetical protein [Candidatus Cloacimonadota bacterium]